MFVFIRPPLYEKIQEFAFSVEFLAQAAVLEVHSWKRALSITSGQNNSQESCMNIVLHVLKEDLHQMLMIYPAKFSFSWCRVQLHLLLIFWGMQINMSGSSSASNPAICILRPKPQQLLKYELGKYS